MMTIKDTEKIAAAREELGALLERVRLEKGRTKRSVWHAGGFCTQGAYSDIVRGKTSYTINSLIVLCDALGMRLTLEEKTDLRE